MDEQAKSLDRWLFEIKSIGPKHWLVFYQSFMGQPCSSPMRLYRAVNLYGTLIVMEAIVDSSTQVLTGDTINYVVKVASNKWKTGQQQTDADAQYEATITAAKEATLQHNNALAGKLRNPRRKRAT